MIALAIALMFGFQDEKSKDRSYEGDWYVADSTDNNTGEREVYAFRNHFPEHASGYLSFQMRCIDGAPKITVEWTGRQFAPQTVISIEPSAGSGDASRYRYIFEKSKVQYEDHVVASAETSRQIISDIGGSPAVTITAYLASTTSPVTATIETNGTQGAWARVVRHCPVRKLPMPPL